MFGHEPFVDGSATLLCPPPARRVDPADQVERALRNSPYLALRNVACECRDDVLILRGCLPTYYLKQVAQSVAVQVEGVLQVVNEIQVSCAGMRDVRRP